MPSLETTEARPAYHQRPAGEAAVKTDIPTVDSLKADFRALREKPGITGIIFAIDFEGTVTTDNDPNGSQRTLSRFIDPNDGKRAREWNMPLLRVFTDLLTQDPRARIMWASTVSLYETGDFTSPTHRQVLRGAYLDPVDAHHKSSYADSLQKRLGREVEDMTAEIEPGNLVVFFNDKCENGLPPIPHLYLLHKSHPSTHDISVASVQVPAFTGQKLGTPGFNDYRTELYRQIHEGLTAEPKKLSQIPIYSRRH